MFTLIIFVCLHIAVGNGNSEELITGFKQCPQIRSHLIIDVDQLLGDWHLATLILDDENEELEQRSLCIRNKIIRTNATSLVQIITVNLPEILQQSQTIIDFPTTIITPSVWLVHSPVGGHLKGIVLQNSESNLIMMYCHWHNGLFVHIATVALIRQKTVTADVKLQILSMLIQNGYDPYRNKIINWSDC